MDSRKIISREPLFEIILLNIEREQRACFFFFEMLDFKNRNIGGKEKENGLRKNFNVVRLCYFFTDVKKKRIIIEWLLADSRIAKKSNFFYKRQEKKYSRRKRRSFYSSSFLLLFFLFSSNKQIQSLATRGEHFSNSGGTRTSFHRWEDSSRSIRRQKTR